MMEGPYDILRYPHVTEKSTLRKEQSDGRVIAFQVRKSASKQRIKEAVEQIFEVQVEKVRTANFLGKIKRQGSYSMATMVAGIPSLSRL